MEVISIIWEVMKCTAVPICKRVDYVRNLPKNMKALKEQADSLHAKRDDFLKKIKRLKFEKAPTEHGKRWLQDVEQFEQQLREMEDEYQAATTKGCGIRWCCNVYSRRNLGESVEDMKSKIRESDVDNFDDNFLDDLPPLRTPAVPVLSMKAETVVEATLKELLNFLQDKNIQKIGIWGKGGIGKTTIMKALNNKPKVTDMFDLIIWITVSNTWDIKKLQKEIADRLSLDIHSKSEENVAEILLEKLKGQKYLLLLDDVWNMVDLVKIGVPNASEDNGCKVVLTTREMKVCREMETDMELKMIPWPKKEAWDMVCSKVGDVAMSPEIRGLAEGVVEECAGLPLALSVAAAMLRKEEDVHVWQDILGGLKSPSKSNNIGMDEKVYDILKISYDSIKDKTMKTCFLFCGLYQEDVMIKKSEVIRYWHGEELLLTDGTLVDSYNRGYRVIRDLIDKSLLEMCDDERYVKLHDSIRDMVLRMMLLSHGGQSKHLMINYSSPNPRKPSIEEWESAKRIFFTGAKLEDLPNNPNCPTLSTLIIYKNYKLMKIPEEFFAHMSNLQVLDLYNSRFTHLPVSVVNLINLRSLLLKYCYYLEALPKEVSAMKKLEVLWATETKMEYIPLDVFELPSLKFLKLTNSIYFKTSSPLISGGGGVKWRLKLLEVFVISNDLCRNMSDADIRVIAKELGMLRGLRSLQFDFRTLENFKEFIQGSSSRLQILTKFQIRINCDWTFDFKGKWKKCLVYDAGDAVAEGSNNNNDNDVNLLPNCISEVLACCDYFVLMDHGGVKFPSSLFSSLKVLRVYICERLKKMFSRRFIGHLPNLTELHIIECPELKVMISEDEEDEEEEITAAAVGQVKEAAAPLPKLKILELRDLPELVSLCSRSTNTEATSSSSSLCWPSLEYVEIVDCQKLRRYPLNVDDAAALPQLKILILRSLPEFEWLCSTNTKGTSSSSSLGWPFLAYVEIVDCPKFIRFPVNVDDAVALPKLKILILSGLPEFEGFCSSSTNTKEAFSSSSLCWPSLQQLYIRDCPKLRRLPFNYAPNLKRIMGQQHWWEALEWDDEDCGAAAAKLCFQPTVETTPIDILLDNLF